MDREFENFAAMIYLKLCETVGGDLSPDMPSSYQHSDKSLARRAFDLAEAFEAEKQRRFSENNQ